jgi:hypothetical protein
MGITANTSKSDEAPRTENIRNIMVVHANADFAKSRAFAKEQNGQLFSRAQIGRALRSNPELLQRLEECTFWLDDQTSLYIPKASGIFLDEISRIMGGDYHMHNGVASRIVFKNSEYEPDTVRVIPAELRKEALAELAALRRLGDHKLSALRQIVEGERPK